MTTQLTPTGSHATPILIDTGPGNTPLEIYEQVTKVIKGTAAKYRDVIPGATISVCIADSLALHWGYATDLADWRNVAPDITIVDSVQKVPHHNTRTGIKSAIVLFNTGSSGSRPFIKWIETTQGQPHARP